MKKTRKNEKLREARQERGWTQQRLAGRLGVQEITVRCWERGSRVPGLESRSRLCAIFGMTAAQLGLLPEKVDPIGETEQKEVNRQRMIKRVNTRWISEVLDHSLYNKTLADLSFASIDAPSHCFPAKITDLYDEAEGELLILGEPSMGKSIALLELMRQLLRRAQSDKTHSIPILLNLSSWAEKQVSLSDWLIGELNITYQVPHKLAHTWVSTDEILPLLDGLDEVAETHRRACVEAMNAYHNEHHAVPMVVCSQASEYMALNTPLTLKKAIVICRNNDTAS